MNENLDTAEEMRVILWKAADSVQNSKKLRRLSTQTRSQKNIFQTCSPHMSLMLAVKGLTPTREDL